VINGIAPLGSIDRDDGDPVTPLHAHRRSYHGVTV
jgi:hypothetical protein